MKNLLKLACALAAVLMLSACGSFVSIMPGAEETQQEDSSASISPQLGQVETTESEDVFEEQSFYAFMGWDEFGSNYYNDTPVALSCQVGEGSVSPVFDRASIIAACDALNGMTVTARADSASAQETTTFVFTMSDGTEYSVSFAGDTLSTYTGLYSFSGGDDLFSIAFPIYDSDFDVFDLYFSDEMRTFGDSFETNLPVSVGRRTNGGAIMTATDEDTIRQVFQLLANATLNRVEASPDQNIDLTQTTDYVFTMSDGTTYTFTFTDTCLTVTASAAYGPVYYWLDGIDSLSTLSILPTSTTAAFEGGQITALRTDIQTAADAANGSSDLTVAGVYVSYIIDGESGYLTLSGDTATSFVQTVTSMTATSETQADPSGDVITVSVTLSDGSGPILYFIGGTIQQVVGTYYVCDSGSMESLRSTVLSLAADGNNTGEVSEGTTD